MIALNNKTDKQNKILLNLWVFFMIGLYFRITHKKNYVISLKKKEKGIESY